MQLLPDNYGIVDVDHFFRIVDGNNSGEIDFMEFMVKTLNSVSFNLRLF